MREAPPTLDIVKVFEYVGGELPGYLKDHGWTPVRCPLHGGMSGSINVAANKFNCFGGCDLGKGHSDGDGYDLLREGEGIDLEAAREMAEEQGWTVDSGPARGPARRPRGTARKRPERPQRR